MTSFLRSALFPSRPSACLFQGLGRSLFNGRNQVPVVRHQLGAKLSSPAYRDGPYRHYRCGTSYCQNFRVYPCFPVRAFHTSQPRFAGPLAVFLVKLAGPLSKVTKLAAIVGGR